MLQPLNYNAIDLIIQLLQSLQENETKGPYTYDKRGIHYLLNQSLRQLWLPKERFFISTEALRLWEQLTNQNIYEYFYQMQVVNEKESRPIDLYKGAAKIPYKTAMISKGESFRFREVFHDDHIIPIKLIIERLMELKQPNRDNVFQIIKDIGVCRMLKKEDRLLARFNNRPYDEDYIINNIYREAGIELQKRKV